MFQDLSDVEQVQVNLEMHPLHACHASSLLGECTLPCNDLKMLG
jgi:hypothetical protein